MKYSGSDAPNPGRRCAHCPRHREQPLHVEALSSCNAGVRRIQRRIARVADGQHSRGKQSDVFCPVLFLRTMSADAVFDSTMQPCSFGLFNALIKLEPRASALQNSWEVSVPLRETVVAPFDVKVFARTSLPSAISKSRPLLTVSP